MNVASTDWITVEMVSREMVEVEEAPQEIKDAFALTGAFAASVIEHDAKEKLG